jgi:NAD(P)-dependent dehydrogenase (short-subunit alcohol dehydrogenase family)
MSELEGRVALVTGASRSIGQAAARALAAAGAKLIVTDAADTTALAAELGGLARRQDVTSEADWVETVAFARAEGGGLDILVNNAGLFLMKPVTETSLEEWRRLYSVNVEGVFLGCKHAVPLLAERAAK